VARNPLGGTTDRGFTRHPRHAKLLEMSGGSSVIIPAYKAEAYLATTVGSVLGQTAPVAEIVIASDDGQDYVAVLAGQGVRDPRIRCVSTGGTGTGVASARNAALHAATGRVVVSLDADDLLEPEALAVLGPLARAHGAAYSNHHVRDFASGATLPNYNGVLPEGPLHLREVLTSNLHTYACIAFDRERLANIQWPADVSRWEDVLFFAACADVLGALYHTPQALYVYHRRQGSICNRPETEEEFKRWAMRLAQVLGEHAYLRYRDPATERALRAFFRGQIALQTTYQQRLLTGEQVDYQRFVRDNVQLLATDATDATHVM
jgi:succinoglycan biosynthesis protein ExoO